MFRVFDAPNATPVQPFNNNAGGTLGYSIIFGARNGAIRQAALADTQKASVSAGVANLASVTIWTPAAGNVIELCFLAVAANPTGQVNLLYNGVNILPIVLGNTNLFTVFNGWPGHFLYPVAQPLQLQNATGAASTLTAVAWGAELLG